jgi:hypothetical protein
MEIFTNCGSILRPNILEGHPVSVYTASLQPFEVLQAECGYIRDAGTCPLEAESVQRLNQWVLLAAEPSGVFYKS